MRQPFLLGGLEVMLTASIGIALYAEDGDDGATLLKHADTAMYHAKGSGRDNCQFYNASMTELVMQRMALESALRLALERDEFSLAYQPQIDAVTGRIHSVEALIRWRRPAHGMVPPLEFIPAAEQSGLIVPIGQWVLRTACLDAARWQREGYRLRVAVNLSPLQFKDPNLVQGVLDTLAQTGLAPDLLELELTESVVMADTAATMATLNLFRECGVRIALDDFGTGYSSLGYLKRMPLGNLKVDQSFVMGLPDDLESYAIVRAILAMAKSLGLSVTAEGVETMEQARVLRGMACDSLQGYFFSKPVPAAEIPALLSQCWSSIN
jgi:EAL domain-containing protein (putative c-di-GMP-specific phosphodiesterase class I)